MKKIILTLFAFAMLLTLTQCEKSSPEKLCSDAKMRGKIISTLINNDAYMNQVMDSMRTKHPDVILSSLFVIMKNDKGMQAKMMDNMMSASSSDSSMGKMMSNIMMEKGMMEKDMNSKKEKPKKNLETDDLLKHH
jgi:hypothetical protein